MSWRRLQDVLEDQQMFAGSGHQSLVKVDMKLFSIEKDKKMISV